MTFKSDCLDALRNQNDGFACTSDMGKVELFDLVEGKNIFKFTFKSDCTDTLAQISSGLACASDMGRVKLINYDGQVISNFTFKSDCDKAREQMLGRN